MADKEISTMDVGYTDQERKISVAAINLNKNLDAKYEIAEVARSVEPY
jgi:hypothetical protein